MEESNHQANQFNVEAEKTKKKQEGLKYLDFVHVAAIQALICISRLYDLAKENSGPLKHGVQTVEGTVKAVVAPVYEKFHDVPFDILKFVDRKGGCFDTIPLLSPVTTDHPSGGLLRQASTTTTPPASPPVVNTPTRPPPPRYPLSPTLSTQPPPPKPPPHRWPPLAPATTPNILSMGRKLEGLNKDIDCAKAIRNMLEKKIETLSSNIASKDEEITDILETNRLLRIEFDRLNCEVHALDRREAFLSSELQERNGEV